MRPRWTKYSTLIGYSSGQDGVILPTRDWKLFPAEKGVTYAINNSVIIQTSLAKATVASFSVFACLWNETQYRPIPKLVIWLAPWAGKINQILRCVWLVMPLGIVPQIPCQRIFVPSDPGVPRTSGVDLREIPRSHTQEEHRRPYPLKTAISF